MTELVPPDRRVCERCGRTDTWSEEAQKWVVAETDSGAKPGAPHCRHEWDINGSYNPFSE